MVGVRGSVFPGRPSDRPRRVVEPELDMNRLRRQQPLGAIGRLLETLRHLWPRAADSARPPMRSVDRELAEEWPPNER